MKQHSIFVASENLIRPVMPELDSLRGLAILGVLFLHGFFWPYSGLHFKGWSRILLLATRPGWLGVNLFFVLSGFLITGILLDSKNKPRYYSRFYTRRALRILPAYYSLLILLAILHQASAGFLGLSFIYLANLTNLFGVPADYGPLWSLAVEEHYYIAWPAVVRKLNTKNVAIASAAICVVVPVLRSVAFHYGYTAGLGWYTWFVADGLALGSLLAVVLRSSLTRARVARLCAVLFTLALIFTGVGARFGILTMQRTFGATLQYSVVHVFFAAVLLLFLLLGSSPRKRCVNSATLQFFGYISYGLYLIHLLVFRIYDKILRYYWPQLLPADGHFELVVIRFLVAGGAAVGLAYLSRRYFEEAFLRMKDRFTRDEAPTLAPDSAAAPALPQLQDPGR
ncbi:MAG: acyltransferase [Acidobacteriia bacterium]|nr:acyltransferase [Terriglobia bacterium]